MNKIDDEYLLRDDFDEWADSLDILDFSLIEKLTYDSRLSDSLVEEARKLHKAMLDHVFKNTIPSPFNADKIMQQVKRLEIDCCEYLINTRQLCLVDALTSTDGVQRKAAQNFYQKTKQIK